MTSFFGQVSRFTAYIQDTSAKPIRSLTQGACQAIEDATELANALQSYFSSQSQSQQSPTPEQHIVKHPQTPQAITPPITIQQAFADYSSKREKRARDLVSFSSNFAKVHTANLPYGLGPLVRKLVYAYMPEWGWMWGLKWLYGYQPTVSHVSFQITFYLLAYRERKKKQRLLSTLAKHMLRSSRCHFLFKLKRTFLQVEISLFAPGNFQNLATSAAVCVCTTIQALVYFSSNLRTIY